MRRRQDSRLAAAAVRSGVRDPRVLRAVAEVPRAAYVPAGEQRHAERNRPIRIAGGQFTSQPSLVALMVEALELSPDDRVLEIGTGLGYQTALLARLAAAVWSVERLPELAHAAAANLAAQGVANATVVIGDGSAGLAEHAPYDAIVLSAACPRVPPPLASQLADGGRLVQPVGPSGRERVTLFVREGDALVQVRELAAARFVPLYGEYGCVS